MPTMRQIAKLAGVSITTVSLALHDCPDIPLRTREMVKAIAAELHYVLPEARVRGFGEGRVIGYIIHEWFGDISTGIFFGAMDEAEKYKFGILMKRVKQSQEWIDESIKSLLDMGISGLLLAHSYNRTLPRRILLTLRSHGIHVVQLMNRVFAESVDSICRNETSYAKAAAEHFAALGHRNILALDMDEPDTCWRPAFLARHIDITFIHNTWTAEGLTDIPRAFQAFLAMRPRPTGIVTQTDHDAFRLLTLAQLHGMAVPRDLSLLCIGSNDLYHYPGISAIDLQAHEMGARGIQLLAERIAADIPPHEIHDFQEIVLPATVIDRGSTGAVGRSGVGRV